MDIDRTEARALKVAIVVNLMMAVAGWVTYSLSGSQAMLLDGNFSVISAIATLIALFISRKKHTKTQVFPFGSYIFESLFVMIKGILILGVIVMAIVQNAITIIQFAKGVAIPSVEISFILYYSVVIAILCFGLYFYFKRANASLNGQSSIIQVEGEASLMDGFLTVGVGIVFALILIVPESSALGFMHSIGDAIIVLVISFLFLRMPLKIIKDAFIELGGGSIQDQDLRHKIESEIADVMHPSLINDDNFISKVGSNYLVAIFIDTKEPTIDMARIAALRSELLARLEPQLPSVQLEIIFK